MRAKLLRTCPGSAVPPPSPCAREALQHLAGVLAQSRAQAAQLGVRRLLLRGGVHCLRRSSELIPHLKTEVGEGGRDS